MLLSLSGSLFLPSPSSAVRFGSFSNSILHFTVSAISSSSHFVIFWFLFLKNMQSSGKSSVLESIVGRDFLPRGSGALLSSFSPLFED